MTTDESIPLSQHDVLTLEECAAIRDRVIKLRPYWTHRSQNVFFTLGAASYMDATVQHAAYLNAARATNQLLKTSFADLHSRLRQFFAGLLGQAVFFDLQYALPGFHIFTLGGEDRSQDNPATRAHFDLQWMHAIPGLAPTRTLSFTLPIDEPSGGASMEVWPLRHSDAARLGVSARDFAMQHPSQQVIYTGGRVVIHDGYILHAIGRGTAQAPKGYRITLQGHGVRLPQGWMLYW